MASKEYQVNLQEYYAVSLQAAWSAISPQLKTDAEKEQRVEIDTLFENLQSELLAQAGKEFPAPKLWNDLYLIELRLIPLMPEEMIDAQAAKRIAEAENLKLSALAALKASWSAASEGDVSEPDNEEQDPNNPKKKSKKKPPRNPERRLAQKRAVYAELLNEIHWRYTNQRLDRSAREDAAGRLWRIGAVVLVIAALPWLAFLLIGLVLSGVDGINALFGTKFAAKATAQSVAQHMLLLAPAFGLYTALTFGLLGAIFSSLNRFQTEAKNLSYYEIAAGFRLRMLLVRFGAGMVGALILYYIIAGKFLDGDLFPDFAQMRYDQHNFSLWGAVLKFVVPNADFAKLVVWSFIGGFSERFVPMTLERTEKRSEPKQQPSDAQPPANQD